MYPVRIDSHAYLGAQALASSIPDIGPDTDSRAYRFSYTGPNSYPLADTYPYRYPLPPHLI